jgi:hypothetical protein
MPYEFLNKIQWLPMQMQERLRLYSFSHHPWCEDLPTPAVAYSGSNADAVRRFDNLPGNKAWIPVSSREPLKPDKREIPEKFCPGSFLPAGALFITAILRKSYYQMLLQK